MMLGAQRAVLVPFRFPVFAMNLRKGSYLAAPRIKVRAGSTRECFAITQSAKPSLIEADFQSGFKSFPLFLWWRVWLSDELSTFVIGTRPYGCLYGVNLRKGSYLAAQAQGPFPTDVNIERSWLGLARTVVCVM